MRWGMLGWFLIIIGGVLLLKNFTQGEYVVYALKLWPLILVLVGLIGAGSRPSERLYNVLLILVGLVLVADNFYPFLEPAIRWWPLAVIAVGLAYVANAFTYQRPPADYRRVSGAVTVSPQESEQERDVGASVKSFDVQVNAHVASVVISGVTDKAFIATHRGFVSAVPRVQYRESGTVGQVLLEAQEGDSHLALNGALPMTVKCEAHAARVDLDLSLYRVDRVTCETHAGSTRVRIGRLADHVSVVGEVGTGKLTVEIPKDTGIRAATKGELSGSNIRGLGLVESEGVFTSPGYDATPMKVDLDINLQLSHFELRLV